MAPLKQEDFLYGLEWDEKVDSQCAEVLSDQALYGSFNPNGGDNSNAISTAQYVVNKNMNKSFDLKTCWRQTHKLKKRYRVFSWLLTFDGARYDESTNRMHVSSTVWSSIVKLEVFANAYDNIVLEQDHHLIYLHVNSVWTMNNWDKYFFTNGWDPNEEGDFMFKLKRAVDKRIIDDDALYANMISTLVREYDDPDDPQYSKDGIREKIRSIAYVYQLFKRFAFKTVRVEFNFHQWEAQVNDDYWENPGKEPQYAWFFRTQDFSLYQQCFHVFDVWDLNRFSHGDIESIDPENVDGVEVCDEEDVFKSYYQEG